MPTAAGPASARVAAANATRTARARARVAGPPHRDTCASLHADAAVLQTRLVAVHDGRLRPAPVLAQWNPVERRTYSPCSPRCQYHEQGVTVPARLRDVLAQPIVKQVDPVRNFVAPPRWPLSPTVARRNLNGLSESSRSVERSRCMGLFSDQTGCIMRTNSFLSSLFLSFDTSVPHISRSYLQISV
jgi:hypothetical protein